MYILGIDTTAVTATAAVCEAENGVIGRHALLSMKNGMTHSENILPIIDSALRMMNITVSDLGMIAVDIGPGSFTGVRIGVATVKGLAYPSNIPVCGVSTLEALAENCFIPGGIVCPVMDARRNQFYNALFEDGKQICEDRCVPFEEILADIENTGKPVILCGDGARLFKSLCGERANISVSPLCAEDQNGLSVALAGLRAYNSGKQTTQALLRPVYLRPSSAKMLDCR